MEKQFSIRESISKSWSLIKGENLFLLIGLFLGYMVVYGILSAIRIFEPNGIVGFMVSLLQIFVGVVWSMGMVKILLQIANGDEPEFAAFKDVIPLFWKYLGASILKALPAFGAMIIGLIIFIAMMLPTLDIAALQAGDISSIGESLSSGKVSEMSIAIIILVLIIPIIYLSIRWMFFSYLIIDKNYGAVESLKKSWKMTDGNFWHLILFILASFAIIILGVIALILGIFVSIPLIMMVQTLIYKKLVSKLDSFETMNFE
ncbi:MAG: DUF975 family protein [Bacteroidales bacterium]|nr:DUF975 family protein [Bacteroidales bacterium]